MTCETCASGHRYWFDFNCLRCRARHYVLILLERERLQVRLEMQHQGKLEDFMRNVEEYQSGSVLQHARSGLVP